MRRKYRFAGESFTSMRGFATRIEGLYAELPRFGKVLLRALSPGVSGGRDLTASVDFRKHMMRQSNLLTRYADYLTQSRHAGPLCLDKKFALAVNRTRGSRMASANFTTKPLVLRCLLFNPIYI